MASSWLNNLTGFTQGAYNAVTNFQKKVLNSLTHFSTKASDNEETNTTIQQYKTSVIYGEPLRPTKFLFVPEMNDFYTDEQLNTVYHSADEYRHAVDKYGFIYKSQKFENADTVQKLLDYAKDWIKNNYHGGIINFTITALDMHALGHNDLDKYTVGRRVEVKYPDPALNTQASQTLTIISAEYDLNNPEKNRYKIGIPDVTLNKVYGETSKSGGGGGGGGKTSDETDEETNAEVDGLIDAEDLVDRILDQKTWAHVLTGLNTDADVEGKFQLSDLLTPGERDPTSSYTFAMAADALKSTLVEGVKATFSNIFGNYIKSSGGVDADTISANASNTGRTNAESVDVLNDSNFYANLKIKEKTTTKDLEVTNNATITETTSTKDLEASNNITAVETVKGKKGEFDELTVGGEEVATLSDIESESDLIAAVKSALPKVSVSIDGSTYSLYGSKVS